MSAPAAPAAAAPAPALPPLLAGLTIVDLTMFVAGPFGTATLADLGAEVIKVEPPRGDPVRSNRIGPQIRGENAQFHAYNRNKRSLVLDLKQAAGRAVLLDLVARADAVAENFRPGVLARLGLEHATLAAVNPRIVLASVSAFGQDGPWAQRPGYDLIVQALGGGMSLAGTEASGPMHIPFHLGDTAGGLYGALALLAAVLAARRDGRGRHVEVAMLDAQVALLGDEVTNYGVDGAVPQPHGSGHPNLAPYQCFACADAPIAVAAVGMEKFWQALCAALGRADLSADPRFADNGRRARHRRELVAILEPVFRSRPRRAWLAVLEAADVPAAPVLSVPEALATPQVGARALVERVSLPEGESALLARAPVRDRSTSTPLPLRPAPALGADSDAVLAGLLGYDRARLDALRADGAFG